MTTLICTILALFGGWNLRKQVEPKKYVPNEALALFSQWEMQGGNLMWCREAKGFEAHCIEVDHYMEEELRGFPERVI